MPVTRFPARGRWPGWCCARCGTISGRRSAASAYGREWNALASYPVAKRVLLTAKLARYEADAFGTDTTKLWFQIEAKF
jgi:hypothetical protein